MFEIFERPPADPTRLFLSSSPWPMFIIVFTYLLFVLKLGRQWMAFREPFDLRAVLKVYNLIQIVYNGVTFTAGIYYLLVVSPHQLSCLAIMPEEHPLKNIERLMSYAYYINKYIDLLDTIFIVLRKSYKQISSLHLIHHLYMPITGYFVIRFNGYGGHPIITGLLNLFVHVVMYSYYYISSQIPAIKRRLWWKQYITMLQMLQFVIIFVHSIWTLMQPGCEVSRVLAYTVLGSSATMFTMFTNFYMHAYILPKRHQHAKLK
ncbi:elongation of very long chain fatty acids protein F-like [Drosophila grimshawi]|uniref:elongation of very long chain fatty acids protein F-like n=1 Tax=Drosophila grimshawi TaxID=7222 RepID=UPI000C87164B|nr:elongation of very long chain fatty acids protein F-like [Drosophila grimshawi]